MPTLSRALLTTALLALMIEPAIWLGRTWLEPGYDSVGGWVALLCAALVVWSVRSGEAPRDPRAERLALLLLGAAALVRLAGRVLDVSHIGALALVSDVAAIGLYLRLHARPRPIHPGALAGLFALSLPTEQLLQHVLGHPLRICSAAVAAWVLSPFIEGLERTGALLSTPGDTLLVDLPCSGAQGLFLFGVVAWAFACTRRVGPLGALAGTVAVLVGALLANALRLAILVAGPTDTLIAEPAHSVVGLIALSVGALLPLWVASSLPARVPHKPETSAVPRSIPLPVAALAAAIAIAILMAPSRPMDTSSSLPGLGLPHRVGDRVGQELPLSSQERAYFERFGGKVDRRAYRDSDGYEHAALLIATTAPVRHLHGAGDCLRGAGHVVTRLGIRPTPVASTIYKTIDPQGRAWRVESTLVSAQGEVVDTASEVVWRWMHEGGAWMRVERVTPWDLCAAEPDRCEAFDRALLASLDIPVNPSNSSER